MEKVVVGMSGGIDSFVTALMLKQKNYEVIGVTLELWGSNDLTAVEKLCESLQIPLIRRNGEELFKKVVVDSFVDGYLAARTPSPCCICNSYVKWELLNQAAIELGANYIATGHYVRITQIGKKYYIQKGIDTNKDQSYFLWGVSQDILSKAITPLGDYTKAEIKNWALSHGYEDIVRRKESMGVCFLRGMDYRDFIYSYRGATQRPGKILNRKGEEIGEHAGLLNYTVGQKREIPIVDGQALYVASMDAKQNTITADVKSSLCTMTLWVEQVYITDKTDLGAKDITVKVRGLGLNPVGFVEIEEWTGDRLKVMLSDSAWAVAPGQPIALFRGDRVIGGGIASDIITD